MFKGKKGIYFLISFNVLIWGFFIYRFFSAYSETDNPTLVKNKNLAKFEVLNDSVNYKLNLSYQDPFLKNEPVKKGMKKVENQQKNAFEVSEKKNKKEIKQPDKLIPEIRYFGLVKNNTNGFATAIVRINGISKLIRQDEIIDGLCFKSFSNENLTVLWNKEKIIVAK